MSEVDKAQEKTQKLYKTNVAIREKAEQLFRDSGFEFEGEWFGYVMSTYELHTLKSGLGAGYQKIIAQAEYHTKSLIDALTAIVTTEAGERTQLLEEHAEKVAQLSDEITAQQDELSALNKLQRETALEAGKIADENAELRKYIANLENLNGKNEEILKENKERLEKLAEMVADGQDAVIQKQDLEYRISEISQISIKQAEELATLQESKEALRAVHEEQLRQLDAKHADDLQRAAERADLAQERAIMAVRRELTEQADKERSELMKQMQAEDKQHTAEIRQLLDEMDKLRQQVASGAGKVPAKSRSELGKLADKIEGEGSQK